MLSTAAMARNATEMGEPLPMPWQTLRNAGLTFRRGQLSLIAAAPGVGKSTFAEEYALKSHAPTLYLCPDTPQFEMAERAKLMAGGALNAPHLFWSFEQNMTVHRMQDEIGAFLTVMGDTPSLVVVDSLRNVQDPSGTEQTRLFERIMADMQKLARNTNSHIMLCHHVTGQYNDGDRVIPQSGIEDQVHKQADIVLTLSRKGAALTVAIVKNRGGRADPAGKYSVELWADMARMQIDDRPLEVRYG